MLKRKNTLNAYTEADFINLLDEIIESKGSDDYQDKLLEHFISITEHPAAYFGAFRSVISGLSDHPFRFKPITDSAIIRSLLA